MSVSPDIDECASSPCENGGTCKNKIGLFECTCVFHLYEGTVCQDGKLVLGSRHYQGSAEFQALPMTATFYALLLTDVYRKSSFQLSVAIMKFYSEHMVF